MLEIVEDLPLEDPLPLSFGDLWDQTLDKPTFTVEEPVDYFEVAMHSLRSGEERILFGPVREDELEVEDNDTDDFGINLPGVLFCIRSYSARSLLNIAGR